MLIFKFFDGHAWQWISGVERISSVETLKLKEYQPILDSVASGSPVYPCFVDKEPPPEIKMIRLTLTNGRQDTYLIGREFEDDLFILNEHGDTVDRP